MIIVLEGLNGVGKSSVAEVLSKATGHPILRPWRQNSAQHLGRDGDTLQMDLRQLGVPANTYVDDIYVADFLSSLHTSAILDRSVASGVAYGTMYGDISGPKIHAVLRMWERLLKKAKPPFLYVYMVARDEVRLDRCDSEGRWHPGTSQRVHLEHWFDFVYHDIALPKIRLDTSYATVAENAEEVLLTCLKP